MPGRPDDSPEAGGPQTETEVEEASGSPDPITDLREKGDIDGLLALAASYREGGEGTRDPAMALACYEAAAQLESPEGAYAAAVCYLDGTAGPADLARGAGLLRDAANKGHPDARIHLGNLYELGVHYAADAAKADVWYRGAARAAGIEDAPGSPEYVRAMAALGSIRDCQLLAKDESVPKKDRIAFLKKAKLLGYDLWLRQRDRGDREHLANLGEGRVSDAGGGGRVSKTSVGGSAGAGAGTPGKGAAPAGPKAPSKVTPKEGPSEKTSESKEAPSGDATAPEPAKPGTAMPAFLGTSIFAGAAWGLAVLGTAGAQNLIATGRTLPVLGHRVELILPLALSLLGVLPSFLLNRARHVLAALALAAATGGGGYLLWERAARLLPGMDLQIAAFATLGYLSGILVLGLVDPKKSTLEVLAEKRKKTAAAKKPGAPKAG